MSLKKCNAVCALATTLALLVHVGYNAFAYLTLYYNPTLKLVTAFPFLFCVCLHAAMGAYAVFFHADGTRMGLYRRQNWRTLVQRIAAFVIAPLLVAHMNTFSLLQGAATSEAWGVFALVIALQLAFYAVIAVHVALSVSRALITLGLLGSRETQKRLDRLVCAICAAAMIVAAVIVVRGQLSMFLTN